jgi:branched-chain amino acid transport system substrate-binding protein
MKTTKKLLATLLASAMLVTSFAACGSTTTETTSDSSTTTETTTTETTTEASTTSSDKVVRIGVFEPASGDSASGGKKETLGMQYANAETPTVEIGGETYTVELVYADNGSSTDKAPSAASELVSKDVSIVLGSYGSGVSMAAGPLFNDAGLAALGVTCTNPNVTAGNDYYFRICFLDDFQAAVLANFSMDKFDAKVAYCLGEAGNEYDQGLITYFKQTFEAAGGTVITDSFPTNNSDFTTYLNKAKNEGAEVIFIPVSISYGTQIITQASSLGIEIPFVGSDTMDDNMILEAANGTNIQLYVSTFYQEGGSPAFDEGVKNYINTNSEALTNNGGNDTIAAVTAMGYDAYYVALEAFKAAGSTDPAAVKAALPGVTYDGVSGSIAFAEGGDAIRDTAYIKHTDNAGNWELETVQKVS